MAETNRMENAGAVDERFPTPLYHQIYLVFRNKIIEGEFATDSCLPSEQETSRRFGVSRITAKRALNELAADGLVVCERGRGTRVAYRPPAAPVRANVEGLFENLLAMGLKTKVDLLEFDYTAPSEDVARALKCEAGAEVQRAVRVRRLGGEPFSYLTTYVPAEIGHSYTRRDLASKPLLSLLERGGVEVSSAEQTISATLADAVIGPALDVELGAPLLRIRRIVFDQNERPVELIVAHYRPDRYQYRMMLSRVQRQETRAWSATD